MIVITPASAAALTTVANVRGDLGLGETMPPDAQIERWIAQASSRAARLCNRTFGRETLRERFEIVGERACRERGGLLLDRSPVASIASVAVDGVTLDPAGYESDGLMLFRLRDGARRAWGGREVVVEYVAGWFLPSESGELPAGVHRLPADIEKAVIDLVGVSASEAGRDATIKSETVEGVGATSYYVQGASASLPHPGAEATLLSYRRPVYA